jgi:hypothetical protein
MAPLTHFALDLLCALGETRTPNRLIRGHHRTTIHCDPVVTASVLQRLRALLQLDAWADLSDRYCPMESLDDFVFVLNFVLKKMH